MEKFSTSKFEKAQRPAVINGYTRFEDGHIEKNVYTGRNEKCPCGSGLKYKKCCLDKK